MLELVDPRENTRHLLTGSAAIARGALEAGVGVVAAYPGAPSSEIAENLSSIADKRNIYVEWSANEKVSIEVTAAASFANLRALCPMKHNGMNVASDFLLHLEESEIRGGLVLVSCDDPGGLYGRDRGESRHVARMAEIPCLEPADLQEVKDMTRWAFDLSEDIGSIVFLRSVTRISHAAGNVVYGKLPERRNRAHFDFDGYIHGRDEGMSTLELSSTRQVLAQEKIQRSIEVFEESPFNSYTGPEKPDVLLIVCGACHLYSKEAVRILGVQERVGLLKMGTTWPLPPKFLQRHLSLADKVIIVEEATPFLEENVKIIAAELAGVIGCKTFYGKKEMIVPSAVEMGTDLVIEVLSKVLGLHYNSTPEGYREKVLAVLPEDVSREETFCPGCPHRASYWSIRKALQLDNRDGFLCGDIGCYSMGSTSSGFNVVKTLHAMGSGMGVASGFGKLGQFGMDKPVLAVSGDSTFFHSVMPALANAIHHDSDMTLIVLDNGAAAMSGFQPHPGMSHSALGRKANGIDIARICEAMGAKVDIGDPFDLDSTQKTLNRLMEEKGTTVLILRQPCALSPERIHMKAFNMTVNAALCQGEECGCNRLCTRVFRCPGLVWDSEQGSASIYEAICAGCGVCADICPHGAIKKEEVI